MGTIRDELKKCLDITPIEEIETPDGTFQSGGIRGWASDAVCMMGITSLHRGIVARGGAWTEWRNRMGYFQKGPKIISIEQIDGFGKRPGLWIGNVGQLVKVASFNSFEHAAQFEEWLTSFLRVLIEEERNEPR